MCTYIRTYIYFFPLQNIEEAEQRSLLHRPQDLLFIIYLIPAFSFCVLRGLVRTTATQNIIFIPPRLLSYSNSLVYRLFWTAPASGPGTICTIMSRTWKTRQPILGCRYICLLLPHSASLNKPLMQTHLLVRCWWACCIQHRTTLLHFMDWWCRDVNGCQTWLLCTQEHWHRYVCTDQKESVNNQINEACHDDTSMFCDQKHVAKSLRLYSVASLWPSSCAAPSHRQRCRNRWSPNWCCIHHLFTSKDGNSVKWWESTKCTNQLSTIRSNYCVWAAGWSVIHWWHKGRCWLQTRRNGGIAHNQLLTRL